MHYLKAVIELLINGSLILIFLLHPAISSYIFRWKIISFGIVSYFVFSLFVQSFTFKQYHWPQTGEYFPFTRWAMFAGKKVDKSHFFIYEWQGLTKNKDSAYINPAQLFLTSNAVVHFSKTNALAKRAKDLNAAKDDPIIDAYAAALIRAYNKTHPNLHIEKINLWERKGPLKLGTNIPKAFTTDQSGNRIIYSY